MEFEAKNIKLIIGLGNPDKKYENTYHNVGFLFLDYLQNSQLLITNYQLLKSNAYMNESGKFVVKAIKKAGVRPDELLVVHDDSDIELGKYKLSFGRGAAGHHGVESIQAALKTNHFWRLRIGIRPPQANPPSLKLPPLLKLRRTSRRARAEEFVLKKISPADKKLLEKIFEEIAGKIEIKKTA